MSAALVYIHITLTSAVYYLVLTLLFLCFQVQDAQAAMRLYTMHKKQWEKEMKDARRKVAKKTKKKEEEEEESGSE